MATRTSSTTADRLTPLAGGMLTGLSVEVERHAGRLSAEADARRLAAAPRRPSPRFGTLRRRVGHGLVHIGAAIGGAEAAALL